MKLSLYLFRDTVTTFNGLILPKYLNGDGAYRALAPNVELGFEAHAFIQASRSTPPKWVNFLKTHFSEDDLALKNHTNSFVLLAKIEDRFFAVTFGQGFHALDRSKIEPRFGLKVTLNSLDENQIKTFDTRNLDVLSRQRRTHVSAGSTFQEFELNTHRDLVRYVAGRPSDTDFAKSVWGSDSMGINKDCSLAELKDLCRDALRLYGLDRYKDRFGFIDYVQPISKKDPRREGLEQELLRRLKDLQLIKLSVAYPDLNNDEGVFEFQMTYKGAKHTYDEVSIDTIYDFFKKVPEAVDDFQHVRVFGRDAEGRAVTQAFSLHEYLVCEVDQDGSTFILSIGSWHQVDQDYMTTVRREVAAIENLTTVLNMPDWKENNEGLYNANVAKRLGWALFDKENFTIPGSRDKVEVCDLMTQKSHFICVKEMKKSATLSHLFAQGSVSAQLLRSVPAYRDMIKHQLKDAWGDEYEFDPDKETPTFVYAVGTDKSGDLADSMFFFSAVNLLDHVRRIEMVGYKAALCRIQKSA